MNVLEHAGPKGQIILRQIPEAIWFSSARDTVAFTMLPDEPKEIAAIYVSDMGKAASWEKPGAENWIDARKAFFVIGSSLRGGMGAEEAVPFSEEAAARQFVGKNGGEVVKFNDLPRITFLAPVARRRTIRPRRGRMIMDNKPGRRRFITLMAAFAGLPLLPDRGFASVSPLSGGDRHSARRQRWYSIIKTLQRRSASCAGW